MTPSRARYRLRQAAPLALGLALAMGSAASAADLAIASDWVALTSDRIASRVGDNLTVLIYEDASGTNTAQNASAKTTHAAAQVSTKPSRVQSAQLDLAGSFDGSGQSVRANRLVAQISVTVVGREPNGDLQVAGDQLVEINGEKTHIKVKGRVRQVDIESNNTVISTRLADASINYSGNGLVSRSAKPGLVGRVLGMLGLF